MTTDLHAQIMVAASNAAYINNNNSVDTNSFIKLLDNGYTRIDNGAFNDPTTGFSAALFNNEATNEFLIKFDRTYPLVKEQERSIRTLYDQGVMSRNDLLEKQKEYHAAEQELEAQKKIVQQSRESLEDARRNLEAL